MPVRASAPRDEALVRHSLYDQSDGVLSDRRPAQVRDTAADDGGGYGSPNSGAPERAGRDDRRIMRVWMGASGRGESPAGRCFAGHAGKIRSRVGRGGIPTRHHSLPHARPNPARERGFATGAMDAAAQAAQNPP